MANKNKAKPGTMKKVLKYIGKYKLLLPISILLAIITVGLTLYIPLLIGDAIDLIAYGKTDFNALGEKLLLGTLLIGATALCQWIMSSINNRIAYSVVRDMRRDAFVHMERLPLSYLDGVSRGDVVNRIVNDSDQFCEGLLLGFTQLFTGFLTIIGTLAFMIAINWKIALVVVLLTPLSLFIARFISKKTYNMFRLRSESEAEATGFIGEMISNQKTVKAFSHEDEATADFAKINKRLEKNTLRAIFFSSLTNPTTRFVNNLVYAAVALTGALTVLWTMRAGGTEIAFTIGELSCLLAYANQYTKPFNEISGVLTEFQNALACADRVFELIEEEPESSDDTLPTLTDAEGKVTFNNVSFSYTPEKPLIEGLNLDVTQGKRVAIVGPTGCGKTTLINLIMRFYDVNDGAIKVGGEDIRQVTRHSLRGNIGMVLQDTWLAEGTVKENIAFGRPDATDDEIIAAAKAAHAHGFIKRLPSGYDTVIGEGGEGLSQGQRQLLSIARVMLTLPPMLILDEATSSIDTRTEMKIQDAFSDMMKGRTSFIVAHRLSTIKEADVILVMKDGNIIEQGMHDELLEAGGFYSELYNSQFAH